MADDHAASGAQPLENVWDYPRPPLLEATPLRLRVLHRGAVIADTRCGFRVLETSHPPCYYLPPADTDRQLLLPESRQSFCEFKGLARYWSVRVGNEIASCAAWSYDAPSSAFSAIAGHCAFYASAVDECWVGDELVVPQPGDFYGGWITSNLQGPFKGAPGTAAW
jgi:uncharacterized protein (DUF427 family)